MRVKWEICVEIVGRKCSEMMMMISQKSRKRENRIPGNLFSDFQ